MGDIQRTGGTPDFEVPLFFVSHASPQTESGEGGYGTDLFLKFFGDLTSAVARSLAYRGSAGIGYLADENATAEERAQALSVCQVFVPLISPLYFGSQLCGREWSAFRSRVPWHARETCFAPVTWAPVPAVDIPQAALEVGNDAAREKRADAVGGLYALMFDSGLRQYSEVVREVARTISQAARSRPLAPVAVDLDRAGNAFVAPPAGLGLRIVILAPTTARVPEGRSVDGRYGRRQTDWSPYGGRWQFPIADDVSAVAERSGYEPTVLGFDDVARELLADRLPPRPTVLLIDNWALLDAEWRSGVEAYLRLNHPWYTFMVVRDDQDPDTDQRAVALRGVVDETLSASLDRMRIDVAHAASGNGSRKGFPVDFARVADFAAARFRKSR